jgi:endonuclease/exonuclease/phosphatase family metal-dependent hydrolase
VTLGLAWLLAAALVSDGTFEDWASVPIALRDPADAPAAALDFGEIKVAHDRRFLHLLVDFGRVVNPRSLDGTVSILFDADGNPNTGWRESGLAGVDLRVELSPPQTGGVQLESASGRFSSYEAGLLLAPTYAARQAEIRLDRGARLGSGGPLFLGPRLTVKLVFNDPGGRTVDETDPIVQALTPAQRSRSSSGPDPLRRLPGPTLRVVSWNVAGKAMLTRPDPFHRILSALAPDVILLDEVSSQASEEWVETFLGPHWQIVLGAGGGRQRTVAASLHPIAPVAELRRVDYPAEQSRRILGLLSDADRRAVLAQAHQEGVPTTGAAVEVGGRRLLVVPVDLQCCGDRPGCPEDRIRLMEAGAIHAAVRRALAAGRFDGLLIAGDFNLVASREPLDLMAEGLTIAETLRLDGLSNATWGRRGSQFPPGRLDYLLYSDNSLRLLASFAFRTGDLPIYWLRRHRLQPDDSDLASDHLPIVADFSWRSSGAAVR